MNFNKIKLCTYLWCLLLFGCNSSSADLDYKLQSGVSYKMQNEFNSNFDGKESNLREEYLISVNDLSSIEVQLIKSEHTSNYDSITRIMKGGTDYLSDFIKIDTTSKTPSYCTSINAKKIKSDPNNSKRPNIKNAQAMDLWNEQDNLPNTHMNIGETHTSETSINQKNYNPKIIRTYTLDQVKDNIAYLSYVETKDHGSEQKNATKNLFGSTTISGKLEYDLKNDFYRLMESHTSTHLEIPNKNKDPKEIKSESESIVRITLVK